MKKITKIGTNEPLAEKKKLKVAAYCRVSTASDEQLISLEAQKAHYESHIRANDAWDANLGGSFNDLRQNGSDISVKEGTYHVVLDLSSLPYKATLTAK